MIRKMLFVFALFFVVAAPVSAATVETDFAGNTDLGISCPAFLGLIIGSGQGQAVIEDAVAVFVYDSGLDFVRHGSVKAEGFWFDQHPAGFRWLRGSGTLTFTGTNRIVIVPRHGHASVDLKGNYSYKEVSAPTAYCVQE